jgi:hypothetical protein
VDDDVFGEEAEAGAPVAAPHGGDIAFHEVKRSDHVFVRHGVLPVV